ncbi:hypothetical protein ACOSQ3_031904 [Xanthoceras sorbifolium]
MFFNIFSSKPFPVFASTVEANALLKWKASFANQTQSQLPTWNLLSHNASTSKPTTSPCTCFGICCNRAGSVIRINITGFGLIGTLDEFSFSSFPNLKYIDLAINSLSGTIPSQIACLSKLVYLDLQNNQFSREIPPQIGLLTNLQVLHLVKNQLSGSIPHEIGSLRSLSDLALYENHLHGPIPASLSNLNNLALLYLHNNSLLGSIPPELGNLENLVELDMATNKLIGPIPSTFGNLNKLNVFFAFDNNLSGPIPHEIGNLKSLVYLSLSLNNLYGSIPALFGGLGSLTLLHLYENKLSGPIPKQLGNLTSLTNLELSQNQLTGEIPISFHNLINLEYLYLYGNKLTCSILSTFGNLTKLKALYLRDNSLSGSIPPELGNLKSLVNLSLSSNNLSGSITPTFGVLEALLFFVFMKINFQAPFLKIFNLQSNLLQGPLPVPPTTLEYLLISNNQLTGEIHHSICNLSALQLLDLSHNNLSGTLTDTFPCWLGALPKLQVLVLRSNKFHGFVNDSEAQKSFSNKSFSSNNFNGFLSASYFASLQAMMNVDGAESKLEYMGDSLYHDSISVTIKHNVIEMVIILSIFTTIDFSNNSISGEIPEEIGKLQSLHLLNLSQNLLTGHIPSSQGNLTALESLDLSSNRLVGEIPRQLASSQLDTFGSDSYSDNLGLCGLPLSNDCHRGETPQPSRIPEDDTESEYAFGWKVVLMGYGSGMVLGMTMGYLVFSTGKPWWLIAKVPMFKRVIFDNVLVLLEIMSFCCEYFAVEFVLSSHSGDFALCFIGLGWYRLNSSCCAWFCGIMCFKMNVDASVAENSGLVGVGLDLGLVISDIFDLARELNVLGFSFVIRIANRVADSLVKVVLSFTFDLFWIELCSPECCERNIIHTVVFLEDEIEFEYDGGGDDLNGYNQNLRDGHQSLLFFYFSLFCNELK